MQLNIKKFSIIIYVYIIKKNVLACPQCAESMHPCDIHTLLLNYPAVMNKYEDFMVRRVLLGDPDSRWCPAPDCR